jgi:hypothetical protein
MTAVSNVFTPPIGGGMPHGSPEVGVDSDEPVRTRGRATIAVTERNGNRLVAKVRGFFARTGDDLADAWWTPESLPAIERDRVPGGNAVLYGGWVAYQHAVAIPAVAVIHAAVGVLNIALWLVLHPARLLLASIVFAAAVALIYTY